MTVSYSREVFTSTGTGIFLRLLGRWKGSIYKLVWRDLLVYMFFYVLLSILYRFQLSDNARDHFEKISLHCGHFADLIPVTFVLGFYVSVVITRWWQQFESIPWPDSPALWITNCIQGHDERGRLMRRTIMRYMNLSLILTLRLICLPVKKRFPHYDHLVEAGILEKGEKKIMEIMDEKASHPKYWMPLVWAGAIVTRARKEKRITNDYATAQLMEKLDQFRGNTGALLNYDWVTVPLVYTQVVTLAVYTFLLSTLMGRQFLDPSKKYNGHEADLVIPVFTFLQFFFYMGWLKVAEALINPFGEDDDDFEMNWVIDRNFQVSYLIVDEMHQEHPDLIKDQFWDDLYPEIPYTAAAEVQRGPDPVIGAASNIKIPDKDAEFLPIYDDAIGDRHSLMRSSANLTEVVIDKDNKKTTISTPNNRNIRKGSFENIRKSPLGSKMRNVKSDVAFFIGNDTLDTEPLEIPENVEKPKNTEDEDGTIRHYQNNIINFASPKRMLKEKSKKISNRFGSSSQTLELGHSGSAQGMALLNPEPSSTNTLRSCASKKSKYSGGKSAIRDLLTKVIKGGPTLSSQEGGASQFASRSNSRLGLGSSISLFSKNSNKRRKYRRPSRFSRGGGGSTRISRTNSRVSTLSHRSSIISSCNYKREDLVGDGNKNDHEDLISNVSDNSDEEKGNDDDDDAIFRLSHSSLSSLDSDMTERTDGTRRIQKVVRDVLKRDFGSFTGTRNIQTDSPKISHNEAKSAAKTLLRHLQQGTSDTESNFRPAHQRNRISSFGSPATNCKNSCNHLHTPDAHWDNRNELRIKLELMQKLQTELLQIIEDKEDKDAVHSTSMDRENNFALDGCSSSDDTMKQLLEEHSNLLKKTLLISTRRKSTGSKVPHRGELSLDLNASTNSTWSSLLPTEEKEVSGFEKEMASSPRFIPRSRNLSKENIPVLNNQCLMNSGIEDLNPISMDVKTDPDHNVLKVLCTNHLDLSLIKDDLEDMSCTPALIPTTLQPLLYQSANKEPQIATKHEKSDSINNDRYESIAFLNAESIFSGSEDAHKERNDQFKDNSAISSNPIYNTSESGQSIMSSVSKSNSIILSSPDIATSLASDVESHDLVALQASMEAILVASATPEIHSQYELATIEEQPELGYQSDSSDTDSLATRTKIINNSTSQNVKRKSINATCNSSEPNNGTSSSDAGNKVLAPVIEDMMEGNDNGFD